MTIHAALFLWLCLLAAGCQQNDGQQSHTSGLVGPSPAPTPAVQPGAQVLLGQKLEALKGKRVALVGNHTSLVDSVHLADTLRALGVQVLRVFAPEHGFRGEAEAGAVINSGIDDKTGIPVISLYGFQKAPLPQELQDVDVLLFDLQDVGCRFYTYISTLALVMDACAQADVPLWVLDRPNPNGYYVAGPLLEPAQASFVGMHRIPVVHGMTMGEYARMVNGEGWLPGGKPCKLEVIPCRGYHHRMRWADTGLPWVPPSPNLATPLSAELYPVLCWYEGTVVSVGRGTDAPFEQIGMPMHMALKYRAEQEAEAGQAAPLRFGGMQAMATRFVPQDVPGKAMNPVFKGQACFGLRFVHLPQTPDSLWMGGLQVLDNFYREHQEYHRLAGFPAYFFNPFFDKLAGNSRLRQQIVSGIPAVDIWQGWQADVRQFRSLRARYLMYGE